MLILKGLLHLARVCLYVGLIRNNSHSATVFKLSSFYCRLSDTQECLESSLIEKENTLAKTSEKLELIDSLRDALREKEEQHKDVSDRLLQTEHNVRILVFL